jgi:hypothetical protein
VGEVAGQLAVGVGLGEEILSLLLGGGDRVGAGNEAQRRVILARELDQRVGELGGVTARLAVLVLVRVRRLTRIEPEKGVHGLLVLPQGLRPEAQVGLAGVRDGVHPAGRPAP